MDQAAFILSMFGLGSLAARISGVLFGVPLKTKSVHVVSVAIFLRCLATFIFAFYDSLVIVTSVVFTFGFTYGLHIAFIATMTADVVSDIKYMPATVGLVTSGYGVAICTTPFLASKYESMNSYQIRLK